MRAVMDLWHLPESRHSNSWCKIGPYNTFWKLHDVHMCLRAGSCVWRSLMQLLWVSAELFPYVSERPGWGHFQRCIGRKTTEGFWERFIFLRDPRKYNLCSVFFETMCVCSETTESLHLLSVYARWQVGILISPNYEQWLGENNCYTVSSK